MGASYLTHRSQYVGVNGKASSCTQVLSGVPQGSVFCPLLFLLFINDITILELIDSSLILYADDLLLYRAIHSDSDYELLQRDIDKLYTWSEENHLCFNPTKCKYLVIPRKRNPLQPTVNLNINSTVLSKVDHIKYLGVWISGNLLWNKHIDVMCKNARKNLGFMYRLFYQHSSTATLRHLYISCVRSQLEYACPVWDPHHTTAVAALEKVQKFALRLCTKNWSHSNYSSLLEQCNLPTLETRRLYLRLCYLYQIINGSFTFPNAALVRRALPPGLRNAGSIQFVRPFCNKNAYRFSYFLHTIAKWKALPKKVQSSDSLQSFKHYLMSYLC